MNEEAIALLKELAEKLGTTSEYLWEALLRQAPITGTIDLLILAGWVTGLILMFHKLKKLSDKEYVELLWLVWGVLACIAALASLTLSTTISALINPEYWALKQLLP